MKILHITPSYEPAWHLGGVVRAVSQLCRGLAKLGLEVTVFTTDSGQDKRLPVPVNRPIAVGGVRVVYFKTDLSLRYAYSRALQKACYSEISGFNLVHLTSFWCYPALPGIAGCLHHRVPYLLSVHGTLRRDAMRQNFLKKWLYFYLIEKRNIRAAAALHYTTEMERELDAFHHFQNPSFIVPNAVEVEEFQELPDRATARQFWGINPECRVVTFLGRMTKAKALDVLIKAVAQGFRDNDLCVLMAGPDGGEGRSLRQLAADLELGKRISFVGEVNPERRKFLLAASDVLTLTSAHENFGITAVEAMLAGVPVLLSDRVGICREVAADGAGLVVPLEVNAIAQGLRELLSEPERLKKMGKAARDAALRRYDINAVARQMARAYEDILTGKKTPGLSWQEGGQ
jgi:glycosyltransferase involved in cell wall biosynthesis